MKKDTFLITAVIILFVFNLLTLAYVMFGLKKDNPPFPPGPPPGLVVEDRLQLNPEQRLQFEELKNEHRKAMESLLNTSRDLHDSYLNELKKDDIDTIKRNDLLRQIGDNQKEIDKVTFTHFEKLRAICTPEQKKLYNLFIDELARTLRPPDRQPDGRPTKAPPPGR
ncbi:MAG: periplasmic heavy metal sensor [Ignavibacteriae bacterium]|nr:MAG: periplasmic heavy metal sensor [Ignavibacteriota bacterium]